MPSNLPWNTLHHVLLDMDGTLLDLHYDATFWLSSVHRIVAEATGESEASVKARFAQELAQHEGALTWYCTDYWAEFFGIDLLAAKAQLAHLIRFRPHAEAFLDALKPTPLTTLIATNAHRDVIDLKLSVIPLTKWVNGIVSSHDYGFAKEHPDFWRQLFEAEHVDPKTTVFIDDSPRVLDAAERAGVHHIIEIRQPNLAEPPRTLWKHGIIDFDDLLPGLRAQFP